MPPSSRKSKRNAEPGAVLQPVAAEGSWKLKIEAFRQKLQLQLKVIWIANSEQTRVDAVEDVRRSFHSLFGSIQEGVSEQALCGELGHVIFSTMSVAVLPEAALNIRVNTLDKECYAGTMQMMSQLVVKLYAGADTTRISRTSMFHVLICCSDNMNASSPAVRYRILQFVNLILKGFLEAEIVFMHSGLAGENFLKKALFDRTYDINSKVAAMAVEAIGHFQFEEEQTQRTKAFSVLWFRMQDHESHLVRAAATRTIQVTPQSAPPIVRRAFDKHPEVRVAAFEVITDMIAAKIVKVQLRSHLLMTGVNDSNALVRGAASACLQAWLRDCNNDYAGLVSDVGVEPGKPLYAGKQIGMEIFDVAQNVKEVCGSAADASSADTRMKSPNENNLPTQ